MTLSNLISHVIYLYIDCFKSFFSLIYMDTNLIKIGGNNFFLSVCGTFVYFWTPVYYTQFRKINERSFVSVLYNLAGQIKVH